MAFRKALKRTAVIGGGAVAAAFGLSQLIEYRRTQHGLARLAHVAAEADLKVPYADEFPSRQAQLAALQNTEEFDVLVVGGGATGVGCALDAVTRNLKTALVERSDFSSGTSSRSTKLIHGGVRYLQKAIMQLDYEQYMMVKEALHERANLLEIAPHLSAPLPIMLPVYKWWQLPYYWAGIKMYDLVAGIHCLKSSYVLSKTKALELFPMLKKDKLVGAIVYYDGQHNDARMNLAIGLTAARYGAAMANYTEVVHLLKTNDPQTGKEKETQNICQPSAGVHIVIPGYYSPDNMGLLDPATSDGRVIFFLPWEKVTIAGTTDTPTKVTAHPIPGEDDINFILREVRNYLSPDVVVRRGDVLAAWSGIRPLVTDPNSKDTQSICRNHIVSISDSGLVTIAGGKWTTYRSMAEETLDAAIKAHSLPAEPCKTVGLQLEGGKGWTPTLYIRLVQDYGLENEHLASTYGGKAFDVAKMAQVTGQRWPIVGKRLVSEFPYIESEVLYAIKEYACTAIDVIARRTRLGFLNVQAADEALPRIVQIMGKELDWCQERKTAELEAARNFFVPGDGLQSRSEQLTKTSEITLDYHEVVRYKKRFHKFDKESKGFITTVDVQQVLESINVHIDENALHDILNEVDLNKNGQVEIDEFMQLMSAVKKGQVSDSRLAILMKSAEETLDKRGPGDGGPKRGRRVSPTRGGFFKGCQENLQLLLLCSRTRREEPDATEREEKRKKEREEKQQNQNEKRRTRRNRTRTRREATEPEPEREEKNQNQNEKRSNRTRREATQQDEKNQTQQNEKRREATEPEREEKQQNQNEKRSNRTRTRREATEPEREEKQQNQNEKRRTRRNRTRREEKRSNTTGREREEKQQNEKRSNRTRTRREEPEREEKNQNQNEKRSNRRNRTRTRTRREEPDATEPEPEEKNQTQQNENENEKRRTRRNRTRTRREEPDATEREEKRKTRTRREEKERTRREATEPEPEEKNQTQQNENENENEKNQTQQNEKRRTRTRREATQQDEKNQTQQNEKRKKEREEKNQTQQNEKRREEKQHNRTRTRREATEPEPEEKNQNEKRSNRRNRTRREEPDATEREREREEKNQTQQNENENENEKRRTRRNRTRTRTRREEKRSNTTGREREEKQQNQNQKRRTRTRREEPEREEKQQTQQNEKRSNRRNRTRREEPDATEREEKNQNEKRRNTTGREEKERTRREKSN
ncbi:Glycerol-3-phosphate dehydrogenase, mitochondrial [Larimichthys crocea]|uniref:Glycerol-3-phosphate dehydrogenase, mitochondrial n=1 Tax=Larimichthys crocea TaxID=215358 RepID=A0A6G0HGG5_LARCR|nr:Glycerol-3-phosphate dehydrogenase, mitochondrial [Larimichthys crocea]